MSEHSGGWEVGAILCMCIAVGFAMLVEFVLGACPPLQMYGWYALALTVVVAPMLILARKRWLLLTYGGCLLVLAVLYLVPWTSRKPFLRDLRSVEVGMSVAEVEEIMGAYMIGTGWRLPDSAPSTDSAPSPEDIGWEAPMAELRIEGAVVYRHSDEPEHNSDWGIVRFLDGRVVETEFMAD